MKGSSAGLALGSGRAPRLYRLCRQRRPGDVDAQLARIGALHAQRQAADQRVQVELQVGQQYAAAGDTRRSLARSPAALLMKRCRSLGEGHPP